MKHNPSRPEVVDGVFEPSLMKEEHVYISLDPADTNAVNRIIEGYEYVGVVTTVVPGVAVVQTTASTRPLALEIFRTLPEVKEILNP